MKFSISSSSIQALMAAGLTQQEAYIWDAISTSGPFNITAIACATQLNRPAVYQHISTLIKKGLVKKVQEKKRVTYQTTGTAALNTWRASHDRAYAQYVQKMQKKEKRDVLPDDVRIYRGKEIKLVWDIVLNETSKNGLFYRYDGYSASTPVTMYLPKDYYEKIEEKKLERFVITNKALRNAPYKKKIQCASRMLPASFDAFEYGVTQFIFEDKIAFIDLTTKTAYIIQNKALAAYHTQLFRFLFKNLDK